MAFQLKTGNSNENLKRNLKGTVPLLALLTAFPPLSTDMILPAIPSMAETWNVSLSVINLILVCFFVTYGFFLLFYGPISDRFGRRRPLLFGLAVYIVGKPALCLCVQCSHADRFSHTAGCRSRCQFLHLYGHD